MSLATAISEILLSLSVVIPPLAPLVPNPAPAMIEEAKAEAQQSAESPAETAQEAPEASTPPAVPDVPPKVEPAPAAITAAPRGDIWWALDGCESEHGRTSANRFQFQLRTWHGIGMAGLPEDHSYEVQRAAAQEVVRRYGWASQFPACSRIIGAR